MTVVFLHFYSMLHYAKLKPTSATENRELSDTNEYQVRNFPVSNKHSKIATTNFVS